MRDHHETYNNFIFSKTGDKIKHSFRAVLNLA